MVYIRQLMIMLILILVTNIAYANNVMYVLTVENADTGGYDASECYNWKLSPQQVYDFFKNSQVYNLVVTDDIFDIYQCGIDGTLISEGKVWSYTINAGGTAQWESTGYKRYFGCLEKTCKRYLPSLIY